MSSWDIHIDSPLGVHWEAVMPQAAFSISSNNQSAQPQPQFHAMLPADSQQCEVQKYRAEDWDAQRPEITRLYLYENETLESVRKFMREQYALDATYEPSLSRHISTTNLIQAQNNTRIESRYGASTRISNRTRWKL